MHVIIGDQKVNLTESAGGRLQATFTATEDTHSVLIPSDCIGTLNVNDIQLEQGSQATSFVEPAVHAEDISGIFKDLRDIRIDIKDTEEGLSHQITINQEGLEQLISDTEERLNSRITLTADTWQGELSDTERELSNQITATAGLWQTKLSDTERGLRSVIQSKADSLITLIEDTDSKNFSKTEQLVNGLQTTVQGDLKSQRTQLENLISSSIESATGSRSTIWQTLNSHGSQISNVQGDISRVEQTVSGYSRRISNVEGNYSTIEQTVSGLNSEVNGYYGGVQSRFRQLEGLIDARVTRDDVEGIIQNSGDNIWLAIGNKVQSVAGNATMSGYEIMSEINLQANRQIFRVSDNRLMITEDTTYISNATIKSSHIASLNADKITAGTLDAGKVRVINLDANNITGNLTEFIKSNWNEATGGGVTITGGGVRAINSEGSRVTLEDGVVSVGNRVGVNLGFIGDHKLDRNSRDAITMTASWGTQIALIMATSQDGKTFKKAMSITSGGAQVNMFAPIDMNYNDIMNTSNIKFLGGTIKSSKYDEDKYMTIDGPMGVSLDNAGITRMAVQSTIHFFTNANFRGNDITEVGKLSYKSDQRLKTNIKDTNIRALDAIRNWKLVSYDWLESGDHVDIGLIAQNTPELMTYDSESDIYGIDAGKQTMYNTLAIQQLNTKVDDKVAKLEQKIANLQDELALLKGD